MDKILIRDLRYDVLIGIYEHERHRSQTVSIDLDIGLPEGATSHDELQYTVDYAQVILRVGKLAASRHFGLVETFAAQIADMLIYDLGAMWVNVSAGKVGITSNARFVGVSVTRSRKQEADGSIMVMAEADDIPRMEGERKATEAQS